jgi:uncharacterized integral membrane protein
MKILRTILWVLAGVGFLIFAIYNWQPVELTLWQNLVLETKVPVLVMLAFLLGFLPTWAVHRSVTWSMGRRIRTLENSLKSSALARERNVEPPVSPEPPAYVPPPVDRPVEKSWTEAGEAGGPLVPETRKEDLAP